MSEDEVARLRDAAQAVVDHDDAKHRLADCTTNIHHIALRDALSAVPVPTPVFEHPNLGTASIRERIPEGPAVGGAASGVDAALLATLDAAIYDAAVLRTESVHLNAPDARDIRAALRPVPSPEPLDVDALIAELSESPLPGARYAVTVVRNWHRRALAVPQPVQEAEG